jgi:DNA-directed RNA polymerase specialized sigma subunit
MLRKSANALPEWARKILAFRETLKLTQGELGKRLSTSAMAVSRWSAETASLLHTHTAWKYRG